MKIYHNPRCSKSRETLALLKENKVEPTVIEYLKTPPIATEIKNIIKLLGIKPEQLLRKTENLFKENFAGKSFSDEEWIQIMANNPMLIERPIFVHGNKAVIGRPPENVLTIL